MSVPAPRTSPLAGLGVTAPVLAAPMAGGPTTAALVAAAARSGGMGFLAAGYKTAEQLERQVTEVRAAAPVFGVNLFPAEIYNLSALPSRVDSREVMAVVAMALALSLAATIYPSWRAARLDPVEALRYE